MNERAQIMNEKLKERDTHLTALKEEVGKKDEVIHGMEQSLSDLARSLDAQNRRIMQLTSKNVELSRHIQVLGNDDGPRSKAAEGSLSCISSNQELDQVLLTSIL
jgi:uncharacterized protein YdcH (DUF465 family)